MNLNKYNDISLTSEALTESLNKKPDINNNKNKKYNIKLTIVPKKKNLFLPNSNDIRNIKSNIFKEELNPIKTIYKTKINI